MGPCHSGPVSLHVCTCVYACVFTGAALPGVLPADGVRWAGFPSSSVTRSREPLWRRPTAHGVSGATSGRTAGSPSQLGAVTGRPRPSFPSVGRREAHGWRGLWGAQVLSRPPQGEPPTAVSGRETAACASPRRHLCTEASSVPPRLWLPGRPVGLIPLPSAGGVQAEAHSHPCTSQGPQAAAPFLCGPPGGRASRVVVPVPQPERSSASAAREGLRHHSVKQGFPPSASHVSLPSAPHCVWTIGSNEGLTLGRQRPHMLADSVPRLRTTQGWGRPVWRNQAPFVLR